MREFQPGDKLVDNDPRMRGRTLTVIESLPNGVSAKDGTGRVRLYLSHRLFTDGKPRKYGYNKVTA